jgi:xylulokinase
VRANIDAMRNAGADIQRVVAVGGGTTGGLWTQIVSDVTGFTQEIPAHTIGASLGGAFLAARLVEDVKIRDWNPIASVVTPSEDSADIYRERYELYGQTYRATKTISHALARAQEMATTSEDLT